MKYVLIGHNDCVKAPEVPIFKTNDWNEMQNFISFHHKVYNSNTWVLVGMKPEDGFDLVDYLVKVAKEKYGFEYNGAWDLSKPYQILEEVIVDIDANIDIPTFKNPGTFSI